MIKFGISDGYNKTATLNGENLIKLYMAKNEGESCVISVLSEEDIEDAEITVNESYDNILVETEREYFISCNGKMYPDPLVPTKKVSIKANELTSILVRFTTKRETEAGEYKYTVSLGNLTFNVEVKVWDFALPEEYVINVSMDLYRDQIARMHNVEDDEEETQRLYEAYYEKLLQFRVSPFVLPYDILDERADKFMSDPRLTAFNCDKEVSADDETLKKYHEKLSKDSKWMKKAMIYPIDEPLTKEHLDFLVTACNRAKELCPEIRRTTAFFRDIDYDENTDEIEVILDNCDLILPKLACFNDDFIYEDPKKLEKYGSFRNRMTKAKEKGKEIWHYVCWEPGRPYVNLYVDESGLDHRIIFWQQHLIGATGFLYWTTNHWRFVENPWKDMATVPDLSPDVFGDGSLLYNGNEVGIDGACASVRLEAVRNGVEDCEMLLIADEVLGRDKVLEKVRLVTSDVITFTESPEVFNKVRREIGDALEEALKAR